MSSPTASAGETCAPVPGRVALLQFPVSESKPSNHETATDYIARASKAGAQLCVLPEIWNGPYATAAFSEYAEELPDIGSTVDILQDGGTTCPSAKLLMDKAREHGMWIVGGSVPERVVSVEEGKEDDIFNTCLCINPEGTIVGKHRKVHLFDINVPGGITFFESDTLSAGNTLTAFDVGEPLGMVGVGICYDIRFPEYSLLLCQKHKCNVLIFPGAFNLTTGPAHWELLQKGRAVDNQCYVMTAAPARTEDPASGPGGKAGRYPHYSSWGHSMVVSPWGDVVANSDEKEALVIADIEIEKVREMRRGIPTIKQKRTDLYRISDP